MELVDGSQQEPGTGDNTRFHTGRFATSGERRTSRKKLIKMGRAHQVSSLQCQRHWPHPEGYAELILKDDMTTIVKSSHLPCEGSGMPAAVLQR